MALRPRAVVVVVLAAYAVGAWVLFSPLGLVDPAHVPGCACGDIAQQVWLLEWARLSASHGTVAWHSGLMDYPRGIDLADSASFPFLGFVAAPLTSLVGPVAALGVLFRVAIWATAAAGFGLARRLGLSRLAAGVAGAASGFGPAMVHQASVHVFLVFLPMLYAAVAVVHAQWTGAPDRWKARGLLLGALVLAQTFTDPEMLLSALLVAVTLIGLVGGWRLARSVVGGLRREPLLGAVPHARSTLAALATAAAVATPGFVVLGWGLFVARGHLDGPAQNQASAGVSLLSAVSRASPPLLASHGHHLATGLRLHGGSGYIGVPVLLTAIAIAVVWRKDSVVAGAAMTAVVAWLFALGPNLIVSSSVTSVPLPFDLLTHVPVFQDIEPSRMTLLLDPALGLLLARGLDLAMVAVAAGRRRHVTRGTRAQVSPLLPSLAVAIAVVASLVAAAPTRGVPISSIGAARSVDGRVVRDALPRDGTVLAAAPFPSYPNDQPLIWQAEDHLRFSLLGGYGNRPGPHGTVSSPALDWPPVVPLVLERSGWGPIGRGELRCARLLLPTFVRRWHVRSIVVDPAARGARVADAIIRADYGPPQLSRPLRIWRGSALARSRVVLPRAVGCASSSAARSHRVRVAPVRFRARSRRAGRG